MPLDLRAAAGAPEVSTMLSRFPRLPSILTAFVFALTVAVASAPSATALLGDIDLSGAVGSPDLDLIKVSLGASRSNPPTPAAQP
jgi:hypothetical protein